MLNWQLWGNFESGLFWAEGDAIRQWLPIRYHFQGAWVRPAKPFGGGSGTSRPYLPGRPKVWLDWPGPSIQG